MIRESGGDRSAVTGGTRVLSDRIVVEITQEPGGSFLDRMIALVEGAERRKTPNEIALGILLAGMTLIFLVVVVTLRPFAEFADTSASVVTLIALLVSLIPTTIGALLSAIGIAGMDRLVRRNVLALSGRSVEASGDVDVLLLDKTGTITLGNRQATEFLPMPGVEDSALAEAAQMASLADETPEGRSIVVLAKQYGLREHHFDPSARFVPFSAETRMSGVDYDEMRLRKGAGDAIIDFVNARGGAGAGELKATIDRVAREGGTPLAVARDSQVLGVDLPEGRGEGGDNHPLRPAAGDGHPDGDDHGRQPAHRGQDRGRVGSRRLPRRGHARAQARADPRAPARRPAGGHDRRRNERRPGAGPGGRGRGHEHRHPGSTRGGEHGGPRLESDEADRDRGDRQAATDHPRRPHHVLGGERRGQVLRDPAGDLRRRPTRPPGTPPGRWTSSTS